MRPQKLQIPMVTHSFRTIIEIIGPEVFEFFENHSDMQELSLFMEFTQEYLIDPGPYSSHWNIDYPLDASSPFDEDYALEHSIWYKIGKLVHDVSKGTLAMKDFVFHSELPHHWGMEYDSDDDDDTD